MKLTVEFGIIKDKFKKDKVIYTEGDIVTIVDDWGKHYHGQIIYIDEELIELKKNSTNYVKTFPIGSIKEIN